MNFIKYYLIIERGILFTDNSNNYSSNLISLNIHKLHTVIADIVEKIYS